MEVGGAGGGSSLVRAGKMSILAAIRIPGRKSRSSAPRLDQGRGLIIDSAPGSGWRPPANHRSFDAPIGFRVLPYPTVPLAQEWEDIRPVVILTQDLQRPVDRWRSFVDEIVDALLTCYHALPSRLLILRPILMQVEQQRFRERLRTEHALLDRG